MFNIKNLFVPQYSEQWYVNLTPAEFFEPRKRYFEDTKTTEKLPPMSDPELKGLGMIRRQQIVAEKLNMTREQMLALDGKQVVALMLEARGKTYASGADEVAAAAAIDSRNASIAGFIKGLGSAGTLVAIVGLGLTIYLNKNKIFPGK